MTRLRPAPGRLARLAPVLLLVAAGFLAGCEEDIVLVETADHPFSLYGVLDPTADTQFVFVFPVEPALSPAPVARIDADVVTTRLADGRTTAWRDSLVFHPTGGYGHVFWTDDPVTYDTRYRLEAARSDGETSRVDIRVPPLLDPRTLPADDAAPTRQRVFLEGPVDRLTRPEVELNVRAVERVVSPIETIYAYRTLYFPLDDDLRRTEDGWLVEVDLDELYEAAYDDMSRRVTKAMLDAHGLQFLLTRVRTIVADTDWVPPEGGWDPERLVHPEALRNVENGFGFVTAGYRVEHAWRPTAVALTTAGFATP